MRILLSMIVVKLNAILSPRITLYILVHLNVLSPVILLPFYVFRF